MATNIQDMLAEREHTSGSFEDNARLSQGLKRLMQRETGLTKLSDTKKEALERICIKISRIVTGNPDVLDHWHDISGYATLIENELKGQQHAQAQEKTYTGHVPNLMRPNS